MLPETTPLEVDYRPAWPDERQRLQQLFAPPFPPGPSAAWLVAVSGSPRERALGLAAIVRVPKVAGSNNATEPSLLFWNTLPAYRDAPLTDELLSYAIETGRVQGVSALTSQRLFEEKDPNYRRLLGLGFSVCERIAEYQAPFQTVWERCRRIYELLEGRGAIPTDARVGGFEPELLPELRAIFHNNRIVGCLDFDARLSSGHVEPIDLERSTAIRLHGRLIGAMLVCPSREDAGYTVAGRWVAEGYRHGWVNALLIYNSVRQGVALDLDFVRFVANSELHRETGKLAARLGGRQVSSLNRLKLDLVPPGDPETTP